MVCTLYEHGSSVSETIVPGDQSRSCDCTMTVLPGLSGVNSLVIIIGFHVCLHLSQHRLCTFQF